MRRTLLALTGLFALLATSACGAGSTSFPGDFVSVAALPGDTVTAQVQFEAEGGHAGLYNFTATPSSGDGLTATISPAAADVDGLMVLDVSIEVDLSTTSTRGTIAVEGVDEKEKYSALTTITVNIE